MRFIQHFEGGGFLGGGGLQRWQHRGGERAGKPQRGVAGNPPVLFGRARGRAGVAQGAAFRHGRHAISGGLGRRAEVDVAAFHQGIERLGECIGGKGAATGQQIAQRAVFQAFQRGQPQPGGVAGAGERHVEFAQVFPQPFAVGGGEYRVIGF